MRRPAKPMDLPCLSTSAADFRDAQPRNSSIDGLAALVSVSLVRGRLRYHVAYYLPRGQDRMVVAEVLDFPGVLSQGFDLPDARLMIASALEDIAQLHLDEGKPLPKPNPESTAPDADLIELPPLSVEAGATRS